MNKFIDEIKKISESYETTGQNDVHVDGNFKALEILFGIAKLGVDKFNENRPAAINIHKLHTDLMPLFFNFQSDCSGFVIKTENKFIFVMQTISNKVFIYGLTSKNGVDIRQSMTRAVQLFNLEFEGVEGIKFYDSTGRELDPEEIILQLINWGLA